MGSCILFLSSAVLFKIDEGFMIELEVLLNVMTVVILLNSKRQTIFVIMSFFAIGIMDFIDAGIVGMFCNISIEQLVEMKIESLRVNSISLILLLIGSVLRHRNAKEQLYEADSNSHTVKQGLLVFFGLFAFTIFMVPIIEMGTLMNEKRSIISITISGVIFLAICLLSLLYIQRNQSYKRINSLYKSMLKEQKQYYESMLKREEETKLFRHDIKNHLRCMQKLLEEGRQENIRTYMQNMLGKVENIESCMRTGNKTIDIIIVNVWRETKGIELVWKGIFPGEVRMKIRKKRQGKGAARG